MTDPSDMRRATTADRPEIEAFLTRHVERSMFPLSNLLTWGMEGAAPRAMRFWLDERGGRLRGVLGQTEEGMILPQMPHGGLDLARRALAGRPARGIVGPTDQVRGLERALGLTEAPRTLAHDEPQFRLSLDALAVPEGPGRIVPLGDAPESLIRRWMRDYQTGTLMTPEDRAEAAVDVAYRGFVSAGSHVVLVTEGRPLAMTGFNARLPEMVQVGGVYTPPDLRGRGHARRAVALHLAEARADGATGATLFASGPAAVRAYEAIGFRRIGDWTILLFDGDQEVAG